MPLILNLSVSRASGALILNLAPPGDARTATLSGRTRVTGYALLGVVVDSLLAGRTTSVRGALTSAYDPNLLSAFHAVSGSDWNDAGLGDHSIAGTWKDSLNLSLSAVLDWKEAEGAFASTVSPWGIAALMMNAATTSWNAAEGIRESAGTSWKDAAFLAWGVTSSWQDAEGLGETVSSPYRPKLPLLAPEFIQSWNDGFTLPYSIETRANDGSLLTLDWSTQWNEAGLAYNAWLPPYVWPKPIRPPKPLILNLRHWRNPNDPLILNLGDDRAIWDIADRRYYSVLNTCVVVRLPDRTELPVTAVSVETDSDSWCWNITLNLAGSTGWTLCQPDSSGLPREVEITINGTVWTGVLDDPQLNRSFNSHKITVKGTSRSAWLASPYAPSTTVIHATAITGQQVAEAALDSSGWALDWQLPLDPDWLIPGDHYVHTGTPIERLTGLIGAVKGCLYSDPSGYGFIAYPRYPVMPWNWDTAPLDVVLPEAALISWNQQSQVRPSVNRVYVSGTTAGVLLQLTKEGTAGDLCANEPIVDGLLTDSYSARARAETELASAGPGFQVTVETMLGGSASVPLIRPGYLCSFAGIRGLVRSCSVSANRRGDGLAVRQSLTLERRIGPWL